MIYYKIIDFNDNTLGCATSHSLRYFNESVGKMLTCHEDFGQYVYLNDQYYRVGWLQVESPRMEGKFPKVRMEVISKEEYETYMKEKRERENLE